MSAWIDFKELRSKLDFETVLKNFGVEVKRKGDQHLGFCPLPNHKGKRNSPSFSANLKRGIFQCFGCGAKGNVLEFAALMSNANPQNGTALREVALELQKKFCDREPDAPKQKKKENPELPVVVNAPLDFTLKNLDVTHPYLHSRGFTLDTAIRFGLGFCKRGMLKDRIAIPLYDAEGNLVGFGGRVVDDATITESNPRYLLPGARERDGKIFEFRKSLFLYNGFRFKDPLDELVVVESFTAVWWLTQHGIPHVVGTMGSDCSDEQAELVGKLVKPTGRVWLLSDGDPAGERFGQTALSKVSLRCFVRWARCGAGRQPTDLSIDQIRQCFGV